MVTIVELPRFIPSSEFYEAHRSRPIHATSSAIIHAVSVLDMRADRVTDALLKIRELPLRMRSVGANAETNRSAPAFSFESFTTLHRNEHELCLGLIGQFWRPDFGLVPARTPDDFMKHNDPGDAKLILRFRAVATSGLAHILETETFVHCPSMTTKLLFFPYWMGIRLASGWIRRRTLSAIERALE